MRKVIYSAACSFDGYISGPDEAVDGLIMSEDAGTILAEARAIASDCLFVRYTVSAPESAHAGCPPGEVR